MEGYISEIRQWASNFAPMYWMFCAGQELQIVDYQALFVLIGTTYGGNGRTTFKLPDLRGHVPVGAGQGPGLPFVQLGESNVQTAQGTDGVPQLGLNYIICVEGIFPRRD